MKEKIAYGIWACLYILCVGLGFVSNPQGFGKVILVATAVIFFLPGGWILYEGQKQGDKKMLKRLRIVCICSLSLTMVALVAMFLAVNASELAYENVWDVLALVSAPMLCMQYWPVSWFLWACLLMGTLCKSNNCKKKT